MNSIIFREMTVDDLVNVEAIAAASFPTPWSNKTFRREIEQNERGYYWVLSTARPNTAIAGPSGQLMAEDEAKFPLIAYGGYWLLDDEAHIVTIATHPELRRLGMAKLLLLNILTVAFNKDVESVSLEVRESNRAAINLYMSLGFTEKGRRKEYYSTGKHSPVKEDALILTLRDLQHFSDVFAAKRYISANKLPKSSSIANELL